MHASKHQCTLRELIWITPTVMRIVFTTKKKLKFQGGQFLSIYVPNLVTGKAVRRAYSFAASPEQETLELCVKYVPGGAGSEFLASLKPGDKFECTAPYGHLTFDCQKSLNACFISTSTGVAPFRSIVLSERFQSRPPVKTLFLFGARTADEILYPGEFEKLGLETVNAVSRAPEGYAGFQGRVTDYLRSLPSSWHWHQTDFYICGNIEMIQEVKEILKGGHGVNPARIHSESFSPAKKKAA